MIKNLLFDLGGVIMDIECQRCVESYRRLGMPHPEHYLGDYVQQGPFMLIESGQITPDEFRSELRRELPPEVTDEQIDQAFFDFLVGIPPHRLRQLRELRQRYRVYMLSNTNPIMWGGKIAAEFRQEGLEREDYFDGIVTSFAVRAMKPEAKIFLAALEQFGIEAGETLFIDDSQANLDAAGALGFSTALCGVGMEFADIIANFEERL